MPRIITICVLMLSFALLAFAQDANPPENKGTLKAKTVFTVKSLTGLNAETSKVGEDVNFELVDPVQGDGLKLDPGAEFLARIVTIEKMTAESKESQISILFDFIQSGDDFMPCQAVIVKIENLSDDVKLSTKGVFEGGTLLTLKGKNLNIPEGSIFKVELIKDVAN